MGKNHGTRNKNGRGAGRSGQNSKQDSSGEPSSPRRLEARTASPTKKEKEEKQGREVGKVVGDYYGRKSDVQGTLESPNQEGASHACTIQRVRKFSVGNQCHQLETDLYWDDPSNSLVGVGIGMERTERLGKRI